MTQSLIMMMIFASRTIGYFMIEQSSESKCKKQRDVGVSQVSYMSHLTWCGYILNSRRLRESEIVKQC